MMSGVQLETCWAFNKLWNNKFYYKAASCWYFYWMIMILRIWCQYMDSTEWLWFFGFVSIYMDSTEWLWFLGLVSIYGFYWMIMIFRILYQYMDSTEWLWFFGFGINIWILLPSPFVLFLIQDFVNYFHTDVLYASCAGVNRCNNFVMTVRSAYQATKLRASADRLLLRWGWVRVKCRTWDRGMPERSQ